ncbi:hypothetical protein A2164_01645 [Candidatus Curtissbacteria bacterium RBG_13_35_7]|uniref:Uncharacterized protein n=1 Tax=Candidatus Curtissbacteria bacterium RBG_13_35_7 TaxID=1797705 RepID=A0A1F5G2T7_9BACT|nr:MAG: hypothetical protein A2164_01645 [Candidatus Curtissbacteria bacterium RBG_13_35_7]
MPDQIAQFRGTVWSNRQLEQNLKLAEFFPTGYGFLLYKRLPEKSSGKQIINWAFQQAMLTGDVVRCELTNTDLVDLVEVFDVKCKCGNPATVVNYCESCGGFKFCEDCLDSIVFYNHSDHDCSKECCANGHHRKPITEENLERMIQKTKVTIMELRKTRRFTVYLIDIRRKTKEEIEQEKLKLSYENNISDWPYVTSLEFNKDVAIETIKGDLTKPYLRGITSIRKLPANRDQWNRREFTFMGDV